jgi:hypothetical protein
MRDLMVRRIVVMLWAPHWSERGSEWVERLDAGGFRELMERVAQGWSTQDTDLPLSAFTEDCMYIEPPDLQYFTGHEQLRPYFDALTPQHFMRFHGLWFDEQAQAGAGEYSFGRTGRDQALHGVVIVELRDGLIAHWREYQRAGPPGFAEFIAIEGKSWHSTAAGLT